MMTSLLEAEYCDNCRTKLVDTEDIFSFERMPITTNLLYKGESATLCEDCFFSIRMLDKCAHDWEAWLSNTSQCVKCGARRDDLK